MNRAWFRRALLLGALSVAVTSAALSLLWTPNRRRPTNYYGRHFKTAQTAVTWHARIIIERSCTWRKGQELRPMIHDFQYERSVPFAQYVGVARVG